MAPYTGSSSTSGPSLHDDMVSVKVVYEDGYRVRRVTFNVLPTEMLVSQMKHMVLNLLNTNLRNRGKLRPSDDYILVYDGHILVEDRTLQENQFSADQVDTVFEVRCCTRDEIDSTYYEQRLVEKYVQFLLLLLLLFSFSRWISRFRWCAYCTCRKTTKISSSNAVPRNPFAQRANRALSNIANAPSSSSTDDTDLMQQDSVEQGTEAHTLDLESAVVSSKATGKVDNAAESKDTKGIPEKKRKKKSTVEVKLRILETVDGNQIGCDISASAGTRFRKIASMYCTHRSYALEDYVFACDGIMMEETKSLAALGLNKSDQVYLVNVFHRSMVNIEE